MASVIDILACMTAQTPPEVYKALQYRADDCRDE